MANKLKDRPGDVYQPEETPGDINMDEFENQFNEPAIQDGDRSTSKSTTAKKPKKASTAPQKTAKNREKRAEKGEKQKATDPGRIVGRKNNAYDGDADSKNDPYSKPSTARKEAEANAKDGQQSAQDSKERSLRTPAGALQSVKNKERRKQEQKPRRGFFKKTRVKVAIALGVTTSLIAVALAIAFLPAWALTQLHEKIQDAFMDRVDYAMREVAGEIFEEYVVQQLIPSFNSCPDGKITNTCHVSPGEGPLREIFAHFRKGRLDRILEKRTGLTLRGNAGQNEIEIFKNGRYVGSVGRNSASVGTVRNLLEVGDFLDSTEMWGVRDNWLIRGALKAYGSKWCILICADIDGLENTRISIVRKIKLKIGVRVLGNGSARVRALWICSQANCTKPELDQETITAVRQTIGIVDTEYLGRVGTELADSTFTSAVTNDILKSIVNDNVVVKRLLLRRGIATETAERVATRASLRTIPLLGQVYFALEMLVAVDYITELIKNREISDWVYERNIGQFINYATGFTTLVDETHSSETTLFEKAGAFKAVQGYASSRVYQSNNGITPLSTVQCPAPTSLDLAVEEDGLGFNDILDSNYDLRRTPTGEPGQILQGPDDPLTCPNHFTRPVVALEDLFNKPVTGWVYDNLNIMNQCIFFSAPGGGLIETLTGIECDGAFQTRSVLRRIVSLTDVVGGFVAEQTFNSLRTNNTTRVVFTQYIEPWMMEFEAWASGHATAALLSISETIFPSVVNVWAGGSELFDQVAGGWDSISNVFAEGVIDAEGAAVGLFGKLLTFAESAELDVAIRDQKQEELQNKSLYARYLDLGDHSSLASTTLLNFASSMPMGGPIDARMNPLAMFSNVGSLLGLTPKASAQFTLPGLPIDREELFGVIQYGYSLSDLDFSVNDMTEAACEASNTLRDASRGINDRLGIEVFTEVDQCKLFKAVELSLTKVFDLNTDAEFAEHFGTPIRGSDNGVGNGGGPVTGSPGICAPGSTEIVGSPFRTHIGTGVTICDVGGGIHVNSEISQNLLNLRAAARLEEGINFTGGGFRAYETQIRLRRAHCGTSDFAIYEMRSSLCRPPTARPGRSQHEQGLAVDFSIDNRRGSCGSQGTRCYVWLRDNAFRFGLQNLPSEAWHWSRDGR